MYKINYILDKYNVSGIYFLKIDTEGHDIVILNSFLDNLPNKHLLPFKILFESNILSKSEDITNIIARLESIGYEVKHRDEADTSMVLNLYNIENKSSFSEPIHNYWLALYPDDYDPSNLPHPNTFEGAKQWCIENNCGGITFQDGRYEVRKGVSVNYIDDNTVISWTYI